MGIFGFAKLFEQLLWMVSKRINESTSYLIFQYTGSILACLIFIDALYLISLICTPDEITLEIFCHMYHWGRLKTFIFPLFETSPPNFAMIQSPESTPKSKKDRRLNPRQSPRYPPTSPMKEFVS